MRNRMSDNEFSSFIECPKEEEVFPGRYERRYFLRGSLATAATVMALAAMPKSVLAQAPLKETALVGPEKPGVGRLSQAVRSGGATTDCES